MAHLLNEEFLKECYCRLGRDRASGIDGVSWEEYGEHLDENLQDLVLRMKAKRYKPQPVKRVYIPKNEHEKRPLGLPALKDKIVQKGISRIVEAIYEVDFLDCSYGFRPGRDCHQAINAVDKIIMRKRVNYVIEADIKGYFDNVSHEWMIKFLQVHITDASFLLLIRRFLKAGYLEEVKVVLTEQGTPQGGNLSPMLSNIFLHYVLDLWFAKKVKPRVCGACELVRYDAVSRVHNRVHTTDASPEMSRQEPQEEKQGEDLTLLHAALYEQNKKGANLYETHPVGDIGLEPTTSRV